MEYRTLSNGVVMPVLGYGMAQVQGPEAVQAVKDAIAARGTGRLIQLSFMIMRLTSVRELPKLMSIDQIYF
nr:hypothetical protein [Weissella cibaria]